MYDQEKIQQCAANLEALVPVMKQMVIDLRTGKETQPYAVVNWLRREISHVVATLGAGQLSLARVEKSYGQLIENPDADGYSV